MKGNTKGDLEIIIQTRQLQYDDSKTHVTQITGIAIVHRIRLRSLRTIFVADVLQQSIGRRRRKNEEKHCHDTSNSRSNTKLPWTELELPPAAPLHWQRKIGGRGGVGTTCTQTVRSVDQAESLATWGTLNCCQSIAHCPAGETEQIMGPSMIIKIIL